MKITAVCLVCISVVLCAGTGYANNLNEPGRVLVYPYVETVGVNYNDTLIKIANISDDNVVLTYFTVNEKRDTADPCDFFIKDGFFELTGKELFYWDVLRGVVPTDPGASGNFIAPMPNFQGLIFLFIAGGGADPNQVASDFLIGSAVLVNNAGAAAQYNAIPLQAIAPVVSDGVLNLGVNGSTMAANRLFFEGFTDGALGLSFQGFLAVAGLDPSEFDVNLDVHNEKEWKFSRHFDVCRWGVYDLTDVDISLTRTALGGNFFQGGATSLYRIWAVMVQNISLPSGELDWGMNVWQDPATANGVP